MREIKFRAYLDDFEEMFYRVWLVESQLYVDLDGKPWDVLDLDDQVHVMQYAGLKDKNGKEIYEGDIVNNGHTVIYASGGTRRFEENGIVKYDIKNGCLVINNTDGYTKRLTYKTIKQSKVEIIGNIYENPELLEAQS